MEWMRIAIENATKHTLQRVYVDFEHAIAFATNGFLALFQRAPDVYTGELPINLNVAESEVLSAKLLSMFANDVIVDFCVSTDALHGILANMNQAGYVRIVVHRTDNDRYILGIAQPNRVAMLMMMESTDNDDFYTELVREAAVQPRVHADPPTAEGERGIK